MIAHDTGYEYVDENDFGMDSLYHLSSILENKVDLVVHCPVLCRHIHLLTDENSAVVLMRRNVEDIIASQKRIGWRWEKLELARYDLTTGVIAEVKYRFWDGHQKSKIRHAFEVQYDDLRLHPLWLDMGVRGDFEPTQTTIFPFRLGGDGSGLTYPIAVAGITQVDDIPGESALLCKVKENILMLNPTGVFIWGLCNGKNTYQDILQEFVREYKDVPVSQVQLDLDKFLSELASRGFIRFGSSKIE
ncbi:MAG: PqqD family protein [Chloroflexota bacterium]